MWFHESPAEVTRLGNWFDYLTIAGGSLSVFSSDGHFRSFLLLAAIVGTLSSLRAPHWKATDIARHAFLWAIALTLIQTVIFSCFAIGIAMSLLNLEDMPPDDREFYTGVQLVSLPLVGGVFVLYWNMLVGLLVGFFVGLCRAVLRRQYDRC